MEEGPTIYQFDDVQVDLKNFKVFKAGLAVHLEPKAIKALVFLIEHRGRLIEKSELLHAVWQDTFVTENAMTKVIAKLRKTLGDGIKEAKYIETVPTRGYRFIAEVEAKESPKTVRQPDLSTAARQRLEVDAEIELSRPQEFSERPGVAMSSEPAVAGRGESMARNDAGVARPTSSAEYLVSEIKHHKHGAVMVLVILTIVVVAVAVRVYRPIGNLRPKPTHFQAIKITKLTTTGNASKPAVSPDGKYVAYVMNAAGRQSLWMRQVATTSNAQLIPLAEVEYQGTTFSRDGNYIYYTVTEKSNPQGALYQIPALGGAPRKLLANIQSPITLSPDGNRLAFLRFNASPGEDVLMLADADGTGGQKLASRQGGDSWFEYGAPMWSGPVWSPDGKVIACGAGGDSIGGVTVIAVLVEDGSQREFTRQRWDKMGSSAWLEDGSGLVVSAFERGSTPPQIWYLNYPSGEVRRITNDFHWYGGLSLTADSSSMVAQQSDQMTNIWVAPNGDASRARQITSSNDAGGRQGLSWTPDGKIVYHSLASGNRDIWIMDADGSNQKQLTVNAGASFNPIVTADGRYIVFVKGDNIWRMDIDGSNSKQLTHGKSDLDPHCSPDSKWMVYTNLLYGKPTLWKVAIDGGDSVQLTNRYSELPAVSPDGKWIASLYWNEQSNVPKRIAIIPFAGGEPIKQFDSPQSEIVLQPIRWTPDGRAITYADKRSGVSNIWAQPIDGGPAKRLTDFKDSEVFWYDWSHDGRQLAFARGAWIRNVVLISDSK